MAKARFQAKGVKTTTKGQSKKYYTQMTQEEINYLLAEVAKIDRVFLQKHVCDKCRLFDIDPGYIQNIFHSMTKDNLIEYNNGRGKERRVVFQDHNIIECEGGEKVYLTFSVGLDTHDIVTVYMNDIYDNHLNVNMKAYDKNLKII